MTNEAKESDPRVQKKLKQFHDNTRAVGAEKHKTTAKEIREDRKRLKITRREEILEGQVLERQMEKFSDWRAAKFRGW